MEDSKTLTAALEIINNLVVYYNQKSSLTDGEEILYTMSINLLNELK